MIYRGAMRPTVFAWSRRDPERAHELVLRRLAAISRHPWQLRALARMTGADRMSGGRELFGIRFPGPVGLAAGFDKNGIALPALAALGFGFIEAGTVTAHAQPGQARPRTWRYPEARALINAMGFPNRGAEAVASFQARAPRPAVPVGWNVSKSLVTDIDDAAADVRISLRALHDHAAFFVINVSSPNTPNLRRLQSREPLEALLRSAQADLAGLARERGLATPRPLLVKIAPDLTEGELDDVVAVCLGAGAAGIIATNTSLRRELAGGTVPDRGGVSGRVLAPLSLQVVGHLARALDGRLPIIGAGGIDSPEAARRMLDAGASLVQVYTGLVYEGPWLVKRINAAVRSEWLAAPERAAVSSSAR